MIDPASECDHFADNALCIYFSLLCHGALCAGRVGTKDKLNEASLLLQEIQKLRQGENWTHSQLR